MTTVTVRVFTLRHLRSTKLARFVGAVLSRYPEVEKLSFVPMNEDQRNYINSGPCNSGIMSIVEIEQGDSVVRDPVLEESLQYYVGNSDS